MKLYSWAISLISRIAFLKIFRKPQEWPACTGSLY